MPRGAAPRFLPARPDVLVVAGLVPLLASACAEPPARPSSAEDPGAGAWIPLFDGRSLAGWTPKLRGHELGDDPLGTFEARDGVLRVRYDGYDRFGDRFGNLFYERPFSHYRLSLEYRFVGRWLPDAPEWARLNSGVMFHAQDPRSLTVDQDWPISLELQFLAGFDDGAPRPTGNLCTPGTEVVIDGRLDRRHCIESSADTYPVGRWVRVELLVLGDSLVRHSIDGEVVLEYGGPRIGGGVVSDFDAREKVDGRPLDSGYLALQSEGQEIDFRDIRLLDLRGCTDPEARNHRPWFVASDPDRCRY